MAADNNAKDDTKSKAGTSVEARDLIHCTNGIVPLSYLDENNKLWDAEIDFHCGAGYVRIEIHTSGHFDRRKQGIGLACGHEPRAESTVIRKATESHLFLFYHR